MPKVRILREAADEAQAVVAWYEQERQGLGAEFAETLEAALDLLEDGFLPLSPMAGSSDRRGAKRLILRRFPFDIVVLDRGDERIVVAFAHHSRKPGYWKNRTRS